MFSRAYGCLVSSFEPIFLLCDNGVAEGDDPIGRRGRSEEGFA